MTKEIQIETEKATVYKLVEALSVNIGKKNKDIDFESLWASEGDEKSLDIYYKEAIGDLENTLKKWILETSEKIDVEEYEDDTYTLKLGVNERWPERLQDLLESKVQDYLAHATLAGWMSGFANLEVGNYTEISASDLEAIVNIIVRIDKETTGKSRHGDRLSINNDDDDVTAGDRIDDDVEADEDESTTASDRIDDEAEWSDEGKFVNPEERTDDDEEWSDEGKFVNPGERITDDETVSENNIYPHACRRRRDYDGIGDDDDDNGGGIARMEDTDPNHIERECLDWSGVYNGHHHHHHHHHCHCRRD